MAAAVEPRSGLPDVVQVKVEGVSEGEGFRGASTTTTPTQETTRLCWNAPAICTHACTNAQNPGNMQSPHQNQP